MQECDSYDMPWMNPSAPTSRAASPRLFGANTPLFLVPTAEQNVLGGAGEQCIVMDEGVVPPPPAPVPPHPTMQQHEVESFLLMGEPEENIAVVVGKALERGVAEILGAAEQQVLIASSPAKVITLEEQQKQKFSNARTNLRRAIFDDERERFLVRELGLEVADRIRVKDEAWKKYTRKPYDIMPERQQIREFLYGLYLPEIAVPPLEITDKSFEALVANGFTYSSYSQLLRGARGGLHDLEEEENEPPKQQRRPREQSPPGFAPTAKDEEPEPVQKKQRFSVKVRLTSKSSSPAMAVDPIPPPTAAPVVSPTPTVVSTPPPTPVSAEAQLELSKRELAENEKKLEDAERAFDLAHTAFSAAKKALGATKVEVDLYRCQVELKKGAVVAAQKTVDDTKPHCMACTKAITTSMPVSLSMTCGHIACVACAEEIIKNAVALAVKTDSMVQCPGCAVNAPQYPACYREACACVVPATAKGCIDPFILTLGKQVDEAIIHSVAIQQLGFPDQFVSEPIAKGTTRPKRSFCPKCNTPTYGLSNNDFCAVRCTNPLCATIYCGKCAATPFHFGKKC